MLPLQLHCSDDTVVSGDHFLTLRRCRIFVDGPRAILGTIVDKNQLEVTDILLQYGLDARMQHDN